MGKEPSICASLKVELSKDGVISFTMVSVTLLEELRCFHK